jgi:prepilin signal peptidase PulO-like enzyme (type II secretory pathway)
VPIVILIFGILGGLCLGSFTNALVWRLHEHSRWRESHGDGNSSSPLSGFVLGGRSMCPRCRHELAPWDLVPVLSWLVLRGRCRYCHGPIEDSPLVEIAMPLLFVFSYVWWPFTLQGLGLVQFSVWLGFGVCMIGLIAYEFRWSDVPIKIPIALVILAAIELSLMVAFLGRRADTIFATTAGGMIVAAAVLIAHKRFARASTSGRRSSVTHPASHRDQ